MALMSLSHRAFGMVECHVLICSVSVKVADKGLGLSVRPLLQPVWVGSLLYVEEKKNDDR